MSFEGLFYQLEKAPKSQNSLTFINCPNQDF